MSENIKYINKDQFKNEVLDADYAVVDFYSTECPPCEALSPKFEHFADLYGDKIKFIKILRQDNRDLAESLNVKSSPTVLFYKKGTELLPRLNGAIKKSNLKRSLLEGYGLQDQKEEIKEINYDVAIIGAGPAGLTAGIYASRAKLKTIIIDKGLSGGFVNITHLVDNYPGTGKSLNGYMLGHFMTEQAKQSSAEVLMAAEITDVDLENKIINIDDNIMIKSKSIIIATGSKPKLLNIPGEEDLTGKGISYCATCDGAFYESKNVIVIGGGNSAVEEAIYLTKFAKKVTIVHQFDELQANRSSQEEAFNNPKIDFLFSHEPRAFFGNGKFEKLEVENLKTREHFNLEGYDGVFIFIGFNPQTEIFKENLEKDKFGYLITDNNMATNINGVYAAGDIVSKKYRQITTAVSDGTIAALEAEKYIKTHGKLVFSVS